MSGRVDIVGHGWALEDYLLTITDIKDRIALTKLRLSNHNLSIEKGRHQDLHLHDRTCPFCPEQIENELHFLIKCPTYESLRRRLLDDVEVLCIGFVYPEDENFLFWLLLSNPIISDSTAKYVRLSLELRDFLLNQHRNNDWATLNFLFHLVLPVLILMFCSVCFLRFPILYISITILNWLFVDRCVMMLKFVDFVVLVYFPTTKLKDSVPNICVCDSWRREAIFFCVSLYRIQ